MTDVWLTPREVSERSGVAVSALHFYEEKQLISSERTAGNQRRYRRDVLRRLAFVQFSQRLGIGLHDVGEALAALPTDRVPTRRDWARLSARWKSELDERIERLQRLRDDLDGCIGCGCLSLRSCAIYNHDDELARLGPGPRRLLT
ncbi:MAG: redox-sensitive transcriptional activator SoxR [Actinomycetales bacterium]|nr:MAG: redox-sensitive transcriptional activator SoxR [Actinomycetales bacterium]